jgi:hypothetical protein
MQKFNTTKLDASTVGVRLSLCAAAIAGTAATAPVANAAIITFSTPIVVPQTTAGVYINLLTGATGSSPVPGWDFNPYNASAGTQLGFYWAPTPANTSGGVAGTTTGPYLDLPPGSVVGPASTFTRVILGTTGSPFLTTGSHILGFSFFNENTSATDYGYLSMTTTAASGFPATINGWSFDDTGAAITVGGAAPAPEPSSLPLTSAALALGALGMRAWRRLRRTSN